MTGVIIHDIIRILRTTGEELLSQFQRLTPKHEWEEMLSLFHDIDSCAAQHIQSSLAKRYPHIGWLGELDNEEALKVARQGEYWVCDAIDGAVQYLRGIPHWAISLTLLRDGLPVMAVVYDVVHQELFHAERGDGAYLNNVAIGVNGRRDHQRGIIAFSHPPFIAQQPTAIEKSTYALGLLLNDVLSVRNLGPTALQICYVACGRLDAFWQYGNDAFNCIGASLVVLEARGRVTDMRGEAYSLTSDSLLAAPDGVNNSIRARLA